MKNSIVTIFFLVSLPVNAHQNSNSYFNHETYSSEKGYAYEEKCFRYEYREDYIPGNSISPGFVRSYKEKVSLPCNIKSGTLNHDQYKTAPKNRHVNYVRPKKCSSSTTLGGLIGGGLAASLSKKDAYSWAIPLGAVLGAGISNAECNK